MTTTPIANGHDVDAKTAALKAKRLAAQAEKTAHQISASALAQDENLVRKAAHPAAAKAAAEEIRQRNLSEEERVAREAVTAALATLTNFLSMPGRRLDRETGEIVPYDRSGFDIENILGTLCWKLEALTQPNAKYDGPIERLEKARATAKQKLRAFGSKTVGEDEVSRALDQVEIREDQLHNLEVLRDLSKDYYRTKVGRPYAPRTAAAPKVQTGSALDRAARMGLAVGPTETVSTLRPDGTITTKQVPVRTDMEHSLTSESADPGEQPVTH